LVSACTIDPTNLLSLSIISSPHLNYDHLFRCSHPKLKRLYFNGLWDEPLQAAHFINLSPEVTDFGWTDQGRSPTQDLTLRVSLPKKMTVFRPRAAIPQGVVTSDLLGFFANLRSLEIEAGRHTADPAYYYAQVQSLERLAEICPQLLALKLTIGEVRGMSNPDDLQVRFKNNPLEVSLGLNVLHIAERGHSTGGS
jgi:hypothetical protein